MCISNKHIQQNGRFSLECSDIMKLRYMETRGSIRSISYYRLCEYIRIPHTYGRMCQAISNEKKASHFLFIYLFCFVLDAFMYSMCLYVCYPFEGNNSMYICTFYTMCILYIYIYLYICSCSYVSQM